MHLANPDGGTSSRFEAEGKCCSVQRILDSVPDLPFQPRKSPFSHCLLVFPIYCLELEKSLT